MDQICLLCLEYKDNHQNHCDQCEKCVHHFHFHSKAFNKCVGRDNILSYTYFLAVTTILLSLLVKDFLTIPSEIKNIQSSNWFFKIIELHGRPLFEGRFAYLVPLIIAEILVLHLVNILLEILVVI